jgi:hypothetical protein
MKKRRRRNGGISKYQRIESGRQRGGSKSALALRLRARRRSGNARRIARHRTVLRVAAHRHGAEPRQTLGIISAREASRNKSARGWRRGGIAHRAGAHRARSRVVVRRRAAATAAASRRVALGTARGGAAAAWHRG